MLSCWLCRRAFEADSAVRFGESGKSGFVRIIHAKFLRFADEKVIEVGAIPVRVGDVIVGAGGDEELTSAVD